MKISNLRIVIGSIIGIFAVAFIFVSLVAFINVQDESLSPDVQAILTKEFQPTDRERAAYFYLLGLQVGAEDPEKAGERLFAEYQGLKGQERIRFWNENILRKRPWKTEFRSCKGQEGCTVAFLTQNPETMKYLEKDKVVLSNFLKLLQYESAETLLPPGDSSLFLDIGKTNIYAQRLLSLQFAAWARAGQHDKLFQTMVVANSYLKNILRHPSNYLEMAIALGGLTENAELLSSEKRRLQSLKIPEALRASLILPKLSDLFQTARERELRVIAAATQHLNSLSDFGMADISRGPSATNLFGISSLTPASFFFRPNETLNKYHLLQGEAVSNECPADNQTEDATMKCLPTYAWLEPGISGYFVNPVGRMLVRMAGTQTRAMMEAARKKLDRIEKLRAEL